MRENYSRRERRDLHLACLTRIIPDLQPRYGLHLGMANLPQKTQHHDLVLGFQRQPIFAELKYEGDPSSSDTTYELLANLPIPQPPIRLGRRVHPGNKIHDAMLVRAEQVARDEPDQRGLITARLGTPHVTSSIRFHPGTGLAAHRLYDTPQLQKIIAANLPRLDLAYTSVRDGQRRHTCLCVFVPDDLVAPALVLDPYPLCDLKLGWKSLEWEVHGPPDNERGDGRFAPDPASLAA